MHKNQKSTFWGWVVIVLILAVGIFALHNFNISNKISIPGKIKGASLSPVETISRVQPPSYPQQALPLNGSTQWFTSDQPIAPFTVRGEPGLHYLVRLYDFNTNKPVMSVFVRNGESVVMKMPLGAFELRYATGDKWYGYEHLFGPRTAYYKGEKRLDFFRSDTQVMGRIITLQRVTHGNLPTSRIPASQF